MSDVSVLGIDLAKNVFELCGQDEAGRVIYRKRLRRAQLLHTLALMPVCRIGMEACAGAHHWARRLREHGHTVRLIPAQYVKPYLKGNKTDRNDAEAIGQMDRQLDRLAQSEPMCQAMLKVPGIGAKTATALLAAVADARVFASGRAMAAWLGLVPRQHSRGERVQLGGISKRGDAYLRGLLIHGARSALVRSQRDDPQLAWARALQARRGRNKAVVALANKRARLLWAMMSRNEAYRHAA